MTISYCGVEFEEDEIIFSVNDITGEPSITFTDAGIRRACTTPPSFESVMRLRARIDAEMIENES